MSFEFEMINKELTLPVAYTPYYDSSPRSYQLSNFGMRIVHEVMEKADLFDKKPKKSFLRHLVFKFLVLTQLNTLFLHKLALGHRSKDSAKVPEFKFTSSDGWVIFPEECELIASRLEYYLNKNHVELLKGFYSKQLGEDETLLTIKEWASYNHAASLNGGYRVW